MTGTNTRKCRVCHAVGPDFLFRVDASCRRNVCLTCYKARQRRYYKSYRDRNAEARRKAQRDARINDLAGDAMRKKRQHRTGKVVDAALACPEGVWRLNLKHTPYKCGGVAGDMWVVWPTPLSDPPGRYQIVGEVAVVDGVRSLISPPSLPPEYQPVVSAAARKLRKIAEAQEASPCKV